MSDCRVYWGHSGCDLPRGHDERPHRQLDPPSTATPETAYLYGEDLTDEERQRVAELYE